MVLCLPNQSLVLLSARQLSCGKLQVGLCKTERRAYHDHMVIAPSVNRTEIELKYMPANPVLEVNHCPGVTV